MADAAPSINLTNHFLIAMPGMEDRTFARSVVYVCEHSERGALGLIINKPGDISMADLFDKVDLPLARAELGVQPVFQGGPVQTERGFVLHDPWWPRACRPMNPLRVDPGGARRAGDDHLQGRAGGPVQRRGPRRVLVTLGYSAWGGGQLESEIAGNSWLTVDADANLIFDTPSSSATKARWRCWACRPGAWPRGGSRLMNGRQPPFRSGQPVPGFRLRLKRTGVASGNRITRSATPQGSIHAEGDARWAPIAARVKEWQPDALVVGVPFHPDGAERQHPPRAALRASCAALRPAGVRGGRALQHHRGAGAGARDADAAAAAIILEQFLRSLA
jgi:putative transcriptional regulator